MLLEAISHSLALDLSWFVALVFGNLFWLMAFAMLGVFALGKGIVKGGMLFALTIYAVKDLSALLGWILFKEFFSVPLLVFLSLFFYDSFFGGREWHLEKRAKASTLIICGSLVFLNLFM